MTIRVVALEKDLFFSVKIQDTLRHHDMEASIARTLPAFEERLDANGEERPSLAIVNIASRGLDWEQAIRSAHDRGYPVLAFGSHMDLDARARALQAGAQRVVANSKFATDMPGTIHRVLEQAPPIANEDEDA